MMLKHHALIALLVQGCLAISAGEAGVVDYHLQLLGLPSNESTFFHPPVLGSKASLLYTLSERNVLGAIKPKDGSVVWRQHLAGNEDSSQGLLVAGHDQDNLVTAVANTVTAWSATDGRFEWETQFPGERIKALKRMGLSESTKASTSEDVIVLAEGRRSTVYRLDGTTGSIVWTQEDTSGDTPFDLASSRNALYMVSAHKALLKGIKLKVDTLDPKNGKSLDQITIASDSEVSSSAEVLAIGVTAAKPVLIWTDVARSVLKVNVLGSKNIASFDDTWTGKKPEQISVIMTPQPSAQPHFLVHYKTKDRQWARVFHVDVQKEKVSNAYDFTWGAGGTVGGPAVFSASAIDGNVYFTRITSEDLTLMSSTTKEGIVSWPIKNLGGAADASASSGFQDIPLHATSEVVSRASGSFAVRAAVLTANGYWKLIQNGDVSWTRPEMLAGLKRAEFVETIQVDAFAQELKVEVHANTFSAAAHRIQRHLQQLRKLSFESKSLLEAAAGWLESIVGRGNDPMLQMKTFGFDRMVVAETERGEFVVLNPSLPQKVEMHWRPDGSTASLSLNEQLQAHLGHKQSTQSKEDAIDGARKTSYGVIDGALQGQQGSNQIWRYMLRPSTKIISITRAVSGERTASIGKVLGDRSVLYKYLNPNAILVMATDPKQKLLDITLLDSASGSVLYSTTHQGVDMTRAMTSAVSENWIAYSFTSDVGREGASRGHQFVVAELYGSQLPNDRGPLGAGINASILLPPIGTAGPVKPHVYAQSFYVPEEISSMTVSQTTQGITSRELIVTLANSNGIVGIPRHSLDPRRPVDKDPSSQQLEEGLMRYYPFIDFNPQWYITHKAEVAGIKQVMVTPSAMESTSLVFAYGLDVFGTRVNPSFAFDILGSGFNKHSLVLTVVALTAACFAVAPFIQKKQTNTLWLA